MKHYIWLVSLLCLSAFFSTACNDDDEEKAAEAAAAQWASQNEQWFYEIADSARQAIAEAKAQYGNDWEQHTRWKMVRNWKKSPDTYGSLFDSVCIHYLERGTGEREALSTDTVRVHFRGWLRPEYQMVNGESKKVQSVFSQSYYGGFDLHQAAPQTLPVTKTVDGFATALQYMRAGDNCYVYMPHPLAYGGNATGAVPAYSTLMFHLYLVETYPVGTVVPPWK